MKKKWYRFDFSYTEREKDVTEHHAGRHSFGQAENEEAAEALFWKCYKPLNLRKLKLHHVTEIDFVPTIGVIGKKVQE